MLWLQHVAPKPGIGRSAGAAPVPAVLPLARPRPGWPCSWAHILLLWSPTWGDRNLRRDLGGERVRSRLPPSRLSEAAGLLRNFKRADESRLSVGLGVAAAG